MEFWLPVSIVANAIEGEVISPVRFPRGKRNTVPQVLWEDPNFSSSLYEKFCSKNIEGPTGMGRDGSLLILLVLVSNTYFFLDTTYVGSKYQPIFHRCDFRRAKEVYIISEYLGRSKCM